MPVVGIMGAMGKGKVSQSQSQSQTKPKHKAKANEQEKEKGLVGSQGTPGNRKYMSCSEGTRGRKAAMHHAKRVSRIIRSTQHSTQHWRLLVGGPGWLVPWCVASGY
jgi:hypothetical protein